jgi:hypothetical protein
MVGAAHKLFGS